MSTPKVTILIPNYKTLDLTKLCLRLLRKNTDPNLVRFLVIDNDSQDESLDYLRSLNWIDLIERKVIPNEGVALSHARALDLGLEKVTTPYVLSIHTDTLVKHPKWLAQLLDKIEMSSQIAGVGSWKLESKPFYKRSFKVMERVLQSNYYRWRGLHLKEIEGQGKNYYYLRSHCALYRTELLKKFNLSFAAGSEPAGKIMHKELTDRNYSMLFLTSDDLGPYIDHINHATMILNPELGARDKTVRKGLRRIKKRLKAVNAHKVLEDASLDD